MAKEIERKFLLAPGTSIPIPRNFFKSQIKQGYLHAEKGKQIRIRITDNNGCYLGIKFTGELVRDEFEYAVPLKDAKAMYEKCSMTVEKKRLSFKRGSESYDVDDFPNGMVFVEVEFRSIEKMEKWQKPHWIGEEITDDPKYSNIVLSKKNLKF